MKAIRCFTNPFSDPSSEQPNYYVSRADADNRVNDLGCCYWFDAKTIVYVSRNEQRDRRELIAAGVFSEAWKQIPSGPDRMPVMQMVSAK